MRVLIVEDDLVSRMMLQRAVEALGEHEVRAASGGVEAWEIFQVEPFDVVISDWVMLDVDGLELCRRIRAHPREGYTYFIFLSALTDREYLLHGISSGADDYLRKPLDLSDLRARLVSAQRVTTLQQKLVEQRSELEELNHLIAGQARTDDLTQLPNRLQLREDLAGVWSMIERYGHSWALALCDVDHFKHYNDHYGHPAGDDVLRAVARTLQQQRRGGDRVYRYGGEEFLLLLPEQSPAATRAAVDRLRRAVEQLAMPHAARSPSGVVTLSAGCVTVVASARLRPDEAIRRADVALYVAKRNGRNRTELYDPSMDELTTAASHDSG